MSATARKGFKRVSLFSIGFLTALGGSLATLDGGNLMLWADIPKIPLVAWGLAIVGGLAGATSTDVKRTD